MRGYRTALIALVALIAGFLLAQLISCHQRIRVVSVPADRMLVSPKEGDVLTWNSSSYNVGKTRLTIPYSLCAPTPDAQRHDNLNLWTVDIGSQGVECKILPQPKASGQPTFSYYEHEQVDASGNGTKGSPDPAPSKGKPDVMLLDIVGGCGDCDGRKGHYDDTDTDRQYYVACRGVKPNDQAIVAHKDQTAADPITVTPDVSSVNWWPLGDLTVTFSFGSGVEPPCQDGDLVSNSSGQTLTLKGLTPCKVNPAAFPPPGGPDRSYSYTVTGACTKSLSASQTMNLSPAPAK